MMIIIIIIIIIIIMCSKEGGRKRFRLDRGLCWSSRNISGDLPGMSNPGLRRSFWKQSGGKELKTRKQLPVSKTGGELKITQDRKRCHYTGSLQDRVKIKEKMKHGLGWRKEIELKRETVSYCCSTRSGNKNKLICKNNNQQDTDHSQMQNMQTKQWDHQPYCKCLSKTGTKRI